MTEEPMKQFQLTVQSAEIEDLKAQLRESRTRVAQLERQAKLYDQECGTGSRRSRRLRAGFIEPIFPGLDYALSVGYGMHFDWNPKKAAINVAKHGVTFEEAIEVFESETLEIEDIEHSDDEDRYWTIGAIARGVVVVVWTERVGDITWIISARFADRAERARYRRYLRGLR